MRKIFPITTTIKLLLPKRQLSRRQYQLLVDWIKTSGFKQARTSRYVRNFQGAIFSYSPQEGLTISLDDIAVRTPFSWHSGARFKLINTDLEHYALAVGGDGLWHTAEEIIPTYEVAWKYLRKALKRAKVKRR